MTTHQDEQLARSWEANADAWTSAVREGRIASRRAGTDAAIVDAVRRLAPRTVLDVGCGEGWLARALAQHSIAVTGIDGSAPLIQQAQALGGGTFRALSYADLVADPAALPGGYDVVVCNFALLDAEPAPLLRALAALAAPDGRLVVQTVHPWVAGGAEPYRDGWRTETFAGFGSAFREQMSWYFRTLGSWLAALAAGGWSVVELSEPLDPATERPLSLLLTARTTKGVAQCS